MAARIIDGKLLAAEMRAEIAAGVAKLKAERGVTPGLAVVLVGLHGDLQGDDPLLARVRIGVEDVLCYPLKGAVNLLLYRPAAYRCQCQLFLVHLCFLLPALSP